ncbi:hypothetical protein EDD85DRAFT_826968 [Armillaria nabsnona]|nr:hypothetical protein EDD85DRAFT_826968 [Armillaria nabsnona]
MTLYIEIYETKQTHSILTSHRHHEFPCHGDNNVLQSCGRNLRVARIGLAGNRLRCPACINKTSTAVPYSSESHHCPHRSFYILGRTSFSLTYSPFVATRLFIKHADPFTVCLATLLFGMSLGCTLDFLFALINTNHIVLRSTFDILSPALLSYIKPYCSMGVVIFLALFSVGLYLQRSKQTNPVEKNKGDVPSERIPASDGDAGAVSNVEKTLPAITLPFPTKSEAISQRTNPDCEDVEVSFLTFLLPHLQSVLIIGPVVLSSYTADMAQVFHEEIVDTGSLGEYAEKSIVPSCRRCLSGHRQATDHSEHIAANIEQSQDNHLVETSPTPSGSPSFLELTDSPSLVTGSDTATATKTTSMFLDLCV